jgi:hypothetical protein
MGGLGKTEMLLPSHNTDSCESENDHHDIGEVSSPRSAATGIETLLEEVSALKTSIEQKLPDSVVEQFPT